MRYEIVQALKDEDFNRSSDS